MADARPPVSGRGVSLPAVRIDRLLTYGEAAVPYVRKFWALALLGGILALAAVVRIYEIGGNPPGFFADEARFGYIAYTILHTGKDPTGDFLPLFSQSFGTDLEPVYIYSHIPFIAVFGLTEVAVRLTSATYGVLTVLVVYLLVRALFRQEGLALAAAGILAILPWHVFYSRIGFGYPPPIFFLLLGLFLFAIGARRPLFWPAAALAFALALYSYRGAWVLTPALLLVLAILYHRELIKHWRIALASLVLLAAASVPIAMHLLSSDTDRAQEYGITSLDLSTQETIERFFTNYRSYFTTSFLFETARGENLRHSLPNSSWLYWWQKPFIVLGLLALLWKPSRPKLLVLALLLVFPLAAALASFPDVNSGRSLMGAPAFAIITAYGIVAVAGLLSRWQRPQVLKVAGFGLAAVFLLATTTAGASGLASYLNDYHGNYREFSAGYWGWQWGPRFIIERFVALEHEYDQLVMDSQFNATFAYLDFYAPNDCGNCVVGGVWNAYDPSKKQLFAVRPGNAWFTYEYNVKGTLYYPSGELAFIFAEITGTRSLPRGSLPNKNLGESGQEAMADLDEAIALDPSLPEAEAYANRGNAHWALENFEQAMLDYEQAVKLDPNLALAYYDRANGYSTLGWHSEAINNYRKAIELAPNLAEAYNNLASVYNDLGEYGQAIAELDEAIKLDPNLALAYANRGNAYTKLGHFEQAIADLDRALDLDSNLAFAYAKRGQVYVDIGDFEQALADFDRAIELDPAYAEPYNYRGFIFAELGDIEQAIADYSKAIKVDRDYALAYANRGTASLKLGDIEQAVADLDQAVELDRAYAFAHGEFYAPGDFGNAAWNLAVSGRIIGDVEEALSLTSDPDIAGQLEEIIAYLSSHSET